jgi:hypothetical protein
LLLIDKAGQYDELISELQRDSKILIKVINGSEPGKADELNYVLDGTQKGYEFLYNNIKHLELDMVIYLAKGSENSEVNSLEELQGRQNRGAFSLLYLANCVLKNCMNKIEVIVVSDYVNEVTGRENRIAPENAILFSMAKTIGLECPNIKSKMVDIDDYTSNKKILEEIYSDDKDYQVAYRNGARYIDEIRKTNADSLKSDDIDIKTDGIYIITGGTGRLGLEIGKNLAKKGNVNIALLSRGVIPDKGMWNDIIKGQKKDDLYFKIKAICEIENAGAGITCYSVDITCEKELSKLLADLRYKYKKINGIIHCAAVGVGGKGASILDETKESIKDVLLPKVEGTWLLDKLTRNDAVEFFIMFSSAITVTGGLGFGSYTAANSYLDSYAALRNKSGRKTLTIDWPAFDNGELISASDNKKLMFNVLRVDIALSSMDQILNKNINRVIIGELNFGSDIISMERYLPFRLCEELKTIAQKYSADVNKELNVKRDADYIQPRSQTEKIILEVFEEVLGCDDVGIYDNFFDLGGNSLLVIKLEVEMKKRNLKVETTDIFRNNNIAELAQLLSGNENEDISTLKTASKEVDVLEEESDVSLQLGSDIKILDNIKPFNEIFYKNCFYNSFFPVVNYFNKNVTRFLVNDILVYKFEGKDEDVALNVEYLPCLRIEQLLRLENMNMINKISCSDIIADIISSVSQNRPVIIWVDCYYESIRTDAYNKNHWPHTLLIYGYDMSRRLFNIIEHRHRNNLTYEKRTLSFEDVSNSYYGFINNFGLDQVAETYMEFYDIRIGEECQTDSTAGGCYYSTFTSNNHEKKDHIYKGLEDLKHFLEGFEQTAGNEALLKINIEGLLKGVNDIINAKNVEKYKIRHLPNLDSECTVLLEKIIDDWDTVRGILARYFYSSEYIIESLELSVEKIKNIYKLENIYLNSILSLEN